MKLLTRVKAAFPALLLLFCFHLISSASYAQAPAPGGDVIVKVPNSKYVNAEVLEDAAAPNNILTGNIDLVPLIAYTGGPRPLVRIISVNGGIVRRLNDFNIDLGPGGTVLTLNEIWDNVGGTGWYYALPLRFVPNDNRTEDASFEYVVVDPTNHAVMSSPSTAEIPIVPVNDFPFMTTAAEQSGLFRIAYHNSTGFTGTYEINRDPVIDFDLYSDYNVPDLNQENFSVRWVGKIVAPYTGLVRIRAISDDGVRLFINDTLVISNWTEHGVMIDDIELYMEEGQYYPLVIDYYERGGAEQIQLGWIDSPSGTEYVLVPPSHLFSTQERFPITFAQGNPPKIIDDSINIKDVDHAVLVGAQVTISNNFVAGEDVLDFTAIPGISGSYDPSTGVLTFSGMATELVYRELMRSITYQNISGNPNLDQRQVTFKVDDGEGYTPFFVTRSINLVNGVLPVTGLTVSAKKAGQKVIIDWSTISERNASEFIVERSTDGRTWNALGKVRAAGNTTARTDYSYIDKVSDQDVYYRVRQVDIYQKALYSRIVKVDGSRSTFKILNTMLRQNEMLRIGLVEGNHDIRVFDAQGKLMVRKRFRGNFLEVPTTGFSKGVYTIIAGEDLARFIIK